MPELKPYGVVQEICHGDMVFEDSRQARRAIHGLPQLERPGKTVDIHPCSAVFLIEHQQLASRAAVVGQRKQPFQVEDRDQVSAQVDQAREPERRVGDRIDGEDSWPRALFMRAVNSWCDAWAWKIRTV